MICTTRIVKLLIGNCVSIFPIVFLAGCEETYTHKGNNFAQMLVNEAIKGKAEFFLGDPKNIRNRVCFAPSGTFASIELKRKFPGLPVVFKETDDSNKWYVAMHALDRKGIVILGIDHHILRWNNYSSAESVKDLNLDKNAKTVCVGVVRISFYGKEKIPTFRPDYQTQWSR